MKSTIDTLPEPQVWLRYLHNVRLGFKGERTDPQTWLVWAHDTRPDSDIVHMLTTRIIPNLFCTAEWKQIPGATMWIVKSRVADSAQEIRDGLMFALGLLDPHDSAWIKIMRVEETMGYGWLIDCDAAGKWEDLD